MSKRVIITKAVAFLLLLVLLFVCLTQVLKRKEFSAPWGMTYKVVGFTNEEKNSMDMMFFGSSHAYCSFDPLVVKEKTGIDSYVFATQQQPMWITYHYILEALKYQSPKVIVVEVFGAKYSDEFSIEATNRSAFEPLKFSKNRNEMLKISVPEEEWFTYYFPLVKYHSRWDEITPLDFYTKYYTGRDELKGYVRLEKTGPGKPADLTDITEATPLFWKTEVYLNNIIELAKEKGIQLVLVGAPCNADVELKKIFNSVEQIAEDNKLPFIDYNMIAQEIGIEPDKHYFDGGHLNYEGATIFTKHFTEYLKENKLIS